jgi:hypothetical protein
MRLGKGRLGNFEISQFQNFKMAEENYGTYKSATQRTINRIAAAGYIIIFNDKKGSP